MTRTVLQFNFFLFALTAFFFNPRPFQAIRNSESVLPNRADTYKSPTTRDGDLLRGIYVANVLDLPVVQQPVDKPYYVSDRDGEATQFSMVSQYGNIGLLAHNTLSGRDFSRLEVGQEVRLDYENGKTEYFVITQILRFQALQPESVASSFRNLDRNETISAVEMFNRAYVGERRLVFQTCIAAEGNASWGRLFIVATPKE
ncbi:MAG TPA: hypothetical protein VK897_21125 [Anaerolineales bacterium]|nr:hypothetical protein [Anaerolineales bacterium]